MRLVYSVEVVADLSRLRAFIAEKDPSTALRTGRELVERLEHLPLFPEMGVR